MIRQVTSEEELAFNGKPLVVCFTNPVSCAPCKALAPHYEDLSRSELANHVEFLEVNIITHMDLALDFDVQGTPTLFYIDEDGVTILNERTNLRLSREISELLGR